MTKANDEIQAQLIAARRNQILEAAARVFAQKGFHSTTIKEVAKEAGIADGTIYNYFENKTALLLGIFERMKDTILSDANLPALATLDLRSFLKAYLQLPLLAFQADDFALFRVVISEIMVNQELRDLYTQKILTPTLAIAETHFQQWAEQHGMTPLHTQLALRAISGMVMGLMLHHIMGDEPLQTHWAELPDFLTELILNGLQPESS